MKNSESRRNIRFALACAAVTFSLAVFAQGQKFKVLHSFVASEGQNPRSGLVRDFSGNLYGTTYYGGIFKNCDEELGGGTLFRLDPGGKLTVLHAFNRQNDGCSPTGIVRDSAGNIYGNAYNNVYGLTASHQLVVIDNFPSFAEGLSPFGPLFRDSEGNLYGTTLGGGDGTDCGLSGCGTVFEIDKSGQQTVLHTFTGGADGSDPQGGVIRDSDGNLYGTTSLGGDFSCSYLGSAPGCGTVFKLSSDGVFSVLHTFIGGTDGENPTSGLTMDSAGNLYGVTIAGGLPACQGQMGCGTVFKIDPSGSETILHAFTNTYQGSYPVGSLALDSAGNLYGTALGGDAVNDGVVFKLNARGVETVLHRFNGRDGSSPEGGVIRDGSGNLYGTTTGGGTQGEGTVFEVIP